MFSRILVANRGEIALRVIRACKEIGLETVGVHSEADVDSLHLDLADQKVCIGPAVSAKSYLDIESIVGVLGGDAMGVGDPSQPGSDRRRGRRVAWRCSVLRQWVATHAGGKPALLSRGTGCLSVERWQW